MTAPPPAAPATTWAGIRIGPLLMIAAGLAFTLMVALAKIARQELSTVDVVFWRGVAAVPLAALVLGRGPWVPTKPALLIFRGGIGLVAMLLYFYAAKGLAVTDQTLLGKLQPLVIAALAPLLLDRSEGGGWLDWVLIAAGLGGSAILLAPSLEVGSWYGLAAFGATFASGLAHLAIRGLTTGREKPATIVFWYQVIVVACTGGFLLATGTFSLPPVHLWPALAGIGALATLGQVLMTHAYARDRAPLVAAAGYTTPLWAVGVDLVIWGVLPGWHAIVGGLVVIAAGLFMVTRGR